jgi:cytochrome P450
LRDPTVILPITLVDEVKSLPESKASLNANNYRRFFGRYTLMGTDDDEFVSAVKQDLTRSVGGMLTEMAEETKFAMGQNIPNLEGEWSSIPVYTTMLQVIAFVSSRVFVGLPLSRNPEWIESTIHYAIDSVAAGDRLRMFPSFVQPFVAPLLPEMWSVRKHQQRVRRMLRPLLAEHLKAPQATGGSQSERGRLSGWLLSHYKHRKADESQLGNDHLLAAFAAIHIATNAITHVLLDLAARPEYVQPLREELDAVLGSGPWQTASLAKLVKMDSFMKESLRVNPPGGVG